MMERTENMPENMSPRVLTIAPMMTAGGSP